MVINILHVSRIHGPEGGGVDNPYKVQTSFFALLRASSHVTPRITYFVQGQPIASAPTACHKTSHFKKGCFSTCPGRSHQPLDAVPLRRTVYGSHKPGSRASKLLTSVVASEHETSLEAAEHESFLGTAWRQRGCSIVTVHKKGMEGLVSSGSLLIVNHQSDTSEAHVLPQLGQGWYQTTRIQIHRTPQKCLPKVPSPGLSPPLRPARIENDGPNMPPVCGVVSARKFMVRSYNMMTMLLLLISVRSIFTAYSTEYMVLSSVKCTSPPLAPPRHVPDRLPVGHLSRAARTHSSHFFLVRVMTVPPLTASSENWALPRLPTVVAERVRHLLLPGPERWPSHIESCAAFCS